MEFVKNVLVWMLENIFDIALVFVGASAFLTYLLQVKNERKTAAALIVEQIDSIEKIVEDLKGSYLHNKRTLDDKTVYLSRVIDYGGAWDSYKHLMIKYLSNSELELLQKFFYSAYQIEKTKSDIIYCFKLSWNNKSLVTHLINGKFHDPTFECTISTGKKQTTPDDLINKFHELNQNATGFSAQISYDSLYAELDDYSALSGTTAYDKLLKLAGRNKH